MTEEEWVAFHLARSPEPTQEQLRSTAALLAQRAGRDEPMEDADGAARP